MGFGDWATHLFDEIMDKLSKGRWDSDNLALRLFKSLVMAYGRVQEEGQVLRA